jgi:molybdopterin converting factor small subunit
MNVSVTFLGLQRIQLRTNQIEVVLPEETRVADVLAYIRKRYPKLPFPENSLLVAVNDKISTLEKVLQDNDNVTFLPSLGGG